MENCLIRLHEKELAVECIGSFNRAGRKGTEVLTVLKLDGVIYYYHFFKKGICGTKTGREKHKS